MTRRCGSGRAGIIVTARESEASRNRVLGYGMTQLDCSSNIAIKGYSDFENEAHQEKDRQQFMLGDTRSLDEMVRYLASRGTITPSRTRSVQGSAHPTR